MRKKLCPWLKHIFFSCECNLKSQIYIFVETNALFVVNVQSPSCVQLFATPWIATRQASPSLTISWRLPKLMSIASMITCSHLILWCSLLLLPSVFPRIRDFFQWVGCSHQVTKIWEFQLQHQSFQRVLRISFKIGWFDLFAVQGNLRSLL